MFLLLTPAVKILTSLDSLSENFESLRKNFSLKTKILKNKLRTWSLLKIHYLYSYKRFFDF